jgi:hypothetical protein
VTRSRRLSTRRLEALVLEGALIALAGAGFGILIGRLLPLRRQRDHARGPVCGCGHHFSHHDPAMGDCRKLSWGGDKCTCRRYSGPEPLPEYYAPEIGG